MFINAAEAHRLATEPVARALSFIGNQILAQVTPFHREPGFALDTTMDATTLSAEYRAKFVLELERAGYTVDWAATDEYIQLHLEWVKPKVFNSKMEV